MTFQKAVSERIYELCKTYNITPNHLAEISSIPPSTLQNITGCLISNPSSFILYQVCKGLNITLKDFFDSELFDSKNIDN